MLSIREWFAIEVSISFYLYLDRGSVAAVAASAPGMTSAQKRKQEGGDGQLCTFPIEEKEEEEMANLSPSVESPALADCIAMAISTVVIASLTGIFREGRRGEDRTDRHVD